MGEEEKWARDSLRDIALEGIRERRRARRWAIFMRFLFLALLAAAFFYALRPGLQMGDAGVGGAHTAVVQINGPIMDGRPANADRIIQGLKAAFEAESARGVLLEINSPGGSPVASSRIYQAIDRLREAYPDKPVHAVAGDVMASGAYYVAAAADEIHVDGASIIGSIGVVSRGFGLSDAIDRLGIERRVYTAGDEKAGMDPFTPPEPDEVERLRGMLDGIHDQFIAAVREGRGDRLTGNPETLFSGRVWTGSQGIEQGLADGYGSPESVAREVIGAPDRVNYTPPRGLLDRALEQVGSAAVAAWVELQSPLNLR